MRMRRTVEAKLLVFSLVLFLTSAAEAADFFPLYPGNSWTYRTDSGETFQITVGFSPIVLSDGRIYHRVNGYATRGLFVRRAEDRLLYWHDGAQQDAILTDFRPLSGAFYTSPISEPCEQDAQAKQESVPFEWAGMLYSARQISYRIYGCADTGVLEELYLENIGLVRRTVQTIAGPRTFTLVAANVGALTVDQKPGVEFRVALSPSVVLRRDAGQPVATTVTMRIRADRAEPVFLRFRSSQRYDIAIKNMAGDVVFLWSSAVAFLPAISEEYVLSKEYVQPLSVNLPDGRYLVEAWLTTASPERQFASATTLWVQSGF
jgi:hypothetical protein